MSALFDVILPVFLVIGFGYIVTRSGRMSGEAIDGLMKFAQNYCIPCLLFRSIATLDLGEEAALGLFISFYSGAFLCYLIGYIAARRIFARTPEESVAIAFACLFSNSLLLGVPITERAYGAEALSGNFTIIALHSPIFYTFGIIMMELARSRGRPGNLVGLLPQIGKGIIRQPLVIGVMCGLVFNLLNLPLPEIVAGAVEMMARAAVPASLFGLGGILVRYRPEGDMKAIAMVCILSVIVHPAITYVLAHWGFGLGRDQLRSAVMTASMAPGVNAYLFAHLYGVAKRVNASAVLIATLGSILTIWAWLHILP